ncbi:MAG: nucleoside recognition domain-containing protein [Eubacteriales bacterium]
MQPLSFLASLAIPCVVVGAALLLLFRGTGLGESFLTGARQGVDTTVKLLPTLVMLMSAVSMLTASGLPALVAGWLGPAGDALGIPSEIVPFLLIRPFSGSGGYAMLADLFRSSGPDSAPALCASVIAGTSDTVFYVFAVYFGSVGVKRSRYGLPVALFVMLLCVVLSCALVGWLLE